MAVLLNKLLEGRTKSFIGAEGDFFVVGGNRPGARASARCVAIAFGAGDGERDRHHYRSISAGEIVPTTIDSRLCIIRLSKLCAEASLNSLLTECDCADLGQAAQLLPDENERIAKGLCKFDH